MRINRLRGALGVSRSGQAQVLNIAITWEDPVRAAQLANAVADAYVVDQLDARLEFGQAGLGLAERPPRRTAPAASRLGRSGSNVSQGARAHAQWSDGRAQ